MKIANTVYEQCIQTVLERERYCSLNFVEN